MLTFFSPFGKTNVSFTIRKCEKRERDVREDTVLFPSRKNRKKSSADRFRFDLATAWKETMWRPLLVVVLASGAEAFAPASSLAGLQCKRLSRSAVSAETRPSLRTVAHARSLKMSLGLNDKSSGTSVDEFRKDGKVRPDADGAGGVGRGWC